jgi:hypothetical protein
VDYESVRGKVFGKIPARAPIEFQLTPSVITNPTRKLHGADVVTLPMMGAALGNQDEIPVF